MDKSAKVFLIGFSVAVVVALVLMFCVVAYANDETMYEGPSSESESWDKWNAGELFAPGTPWLIDRKGKICTKKCWSLQEGVRKGRGWCSSGCGDYHRKHSYRIYFKYQPWFVLFSGGTHGIWIAQTCRTESEGKADNVIQKSLKAEAGLCSVNRDFAKKLNVNSCDPKANIWASAYMRNERLINFRTSHPNVKSASLQQQWFVAGAGGAVGGGKVMALLKKCGIKNGKNQYDALGNCFLRWHRKWIEATGAEFWISKLGLEPGLFKAGVTRKRKEDDQIVADPSKWEKLEDYQHLYNGSNAKFKLVFDTTLGHKPGLVAFRCTRGDAVEAQIAPLFEGGKIPWSEPVLPMRPVDLYPYPGDKLHGKCENWPELKERVPGPEEWLAMIPPELDVRDPETLRIVKGYKNRLVGCVKDPDNPKRCLKVK